jgi:hypothetical protein
MLIDGGTATIGEDNWFAYTVTRPLATPETQGFTVALMMPSLCYGAALPETGWEWLYTSEVQFFPGGTVYDGHFVINCPDMASGTNELWALLGDGDAGGATYPAWAAAGTGHPSPDDPAVLPYVVHSAVVTFTAVEP